MYLPARMEQFMAKSAVSSCLAQLLVRLRLRLLLSLSLCLSSLASLSAQSYIDIAPLSELQPYNLNLAAEVAGMNSAVQTPDGYLWIGSIKGMVISDGHQSVVYSDGDPMYPLDLDAPGAFLGDLHVDSLGGVYAAVSTGLRILRFDPDTRSITAEWSFKDQDKPGSIFFDVSTLGEVFSLLLDQGADHFSIWKMNNDLPNQLLFEAANSEYGSAIDFKWFQSMHWVQTTRGILRIHRDGQSFNFYPNATSTESAYYRPITGGYYFFYNHSLRALMYWDARMDQPKRYTILPDQVQLSAAQMMVRREMLYIANGYYFFILDTIHHTIQDLSEVTFEMKKEKYPAAISEDILGFQIIDQQVFLLGSKYLYKLKAKPPPEELFKAAIPFRRPDVSMRGLAEDDQHNVYASFYNGVVIKPKGTKDFKVWPQISDFNADRYSAFSLTYKAPYLFWHCLRIDTKTGSITSVIPNAINGHIVHCLSGNTLFLYTWYGRNLYLYDVPNDHVDSVRLITSGNQEGTFPFVINKMVVTADHAGIWMATGNDGIRLISIKGKVLQSFTAEELGTTPQEGINDIVVDGQYLWYGCFDGLGRINTKTREYTLYKDPMITPAMQQRPRTIFTILPDEHNGFYLGSHQGLVYFDTTTLQFVHLHPEHPLSLPEFNRTSAFKDSQGRYYLGSTNGLFSFLPEELEFQSAGDSLYPIKLYGIAVFNGEEKRYRYITSALGNLDDLVLRPSETNIEFNLSVPCFNHDIYYSYRIKGIHDQWSEYAANPRVLVYALPPGTYMLEVKASANASDSVISRFQLPVIMSSYWYQKTWIWILLSLGFSAAVAMLIRYWYQQRWRRQKTLEALRIKISSDLHDDVGSILSGLAMQSQVMSYEMPEDKRKPMLELSDMSREAMERMRDTVWAIDARKDKYENLIDRMRDFAEKTLERKNITHDFHMSGLDGKKFISPEVRQNIYLIFKEAITNIIRHSDATHVTINFSQGGDRVVLSILDNGTIHQSASTDGQGISNMKMRAGKIGGNLAITSGKGYEVKFELSL